MGAEIYPADAEQLSVIKYLVIEQVPSKFDPSAMISKIVGQTCPRCEAYGTEIEHGQSRVCGSCRLRMQAFGSVLYCWEENPRPEVVKGGPYR